MKVIKKGRDQKGWSKEYECTGKGNSGGGCGAKLLVSEDDFFMTSHSYYDGSTDRYITFECPCCKVWTDVDNVPGLIWEKCKNKRRSPLGNRGPAR